MSQSIPPSIARTWSHEDNEVTVEQELANKTRFHRGLGESGRVVEHVSGIECPNPVCESTEHVRVRRKNPEAPQQVDYWCLDPGCRHFVSDELSHHISPDPRTPSVDTPQVKDFHFTCMECDEFVEFSTMIEIHRTDAELFEWDGEPMQSKPTNVVCSQCSESGEPEPDKTTLERDASRLADGMLDVMEVDGE